MHDAKTLCRYPIKLGTMLSSPLSLETWVLVFCPAEGLAGVASIIQSQFKQSKHLQTHPLPSPALSLTSRLDYFFSAPPSEPLPILLGQMPSVNSQYLYL